MVQFIMKQIIFCRLISMEIINKAINILDTLDGWDEIPSYIRNSWYKILLADICRTKDVNRQSHGKIREFRNAFIGFSSLENTVSYTCRLNE